MANNQIYTKEHLDSILTSLNIKTTEDQKNRLNTWVNRVIATEIKKYKVKKKPPLPECTLTPVMIDLVITRVSYYFGISREEIMSKSRKIDAKIARYTIIYLLRKANLSLQKCADCVGRKDHTTTINGFRYMKVLLDNPIYITNGAEEKAIKFIQKYNY